MLKIRLKINQVENKYKSQLGSLKNLSGQMTNKSDEFRREKDTNKSNSEY